MCGMNVVKKKGIESLLRKPEPLVSLGRIM